MPKCSHVQEPITQKFIHFPDSDKSSYPRFADCAWYILAPAGHSVEITAQFIDVEYSKKCQHDFLAFVNGKPNEGLPSSHYKCTSKKQAHDHDHGSACNRFCGSSINNTTNIGKTFTSTGREAGVVFHSDFKNEGRGFNLSIKFVASKIMCFIPVYLAKLLNGRFFLNMLIIMYSVLPLSP